VSSPPRNVENIGNDVARRGNPLWHVEIVENDVARGGTYENDVVRRGTHPSTSKSSKMT